MIVVDLEMSGLDPKKCGIVEIGAIELENPANTFNQLARLDEDEIVINYPETGKTVYEILGKSEEDFRDPKLQNQEELLKNFFEWVKDIKEKIFVCQNYLDLAFLIEKGRKYNFPRINFRYLDLHTIAQIVHLKTKQKLKLSFDGWGEMGLKDSSIFCGLKDERKEHTGIEDAKFEAEILNRLLFGKNLLPEYASAKIPKYLQRNTD